MDYPKDQKLFDFNSDVWNWCITNPRTLEPWDLSCCWGAQLDKFGVVFKSQDIRVDKLWYSCFSCDIWIFELWCNVKDQKMLSRCSPLARFALETMLLQRTVKMPQRLSNSTSWNMEKNICITPNIVMFCLWLMKLEITCCEPSNFTKLPSFLFVNVFGQ